MQQMDIFKIFLKLLKGENKMKWFSVNVISGNLVNFRRCLQLEEGVLKINMDWR